MPPFRRARALVALVLLSGSAVAAEPSAEARRLYAEGKAEYAQGHYVEAIGLFERSYALSESSALLFNMAQAHRLAGPEHCAQAVALYKSYLAAEPDAENEQEVQERIQQLGDCSASQPSETAAPATASSSTPSTAAATPTAPQTRSASPQPAPVVRERGLPTAPVLVTGTGAALVVAGGILYASAWNKHREAEKVCPCYPGTYSTWEVLTNVSYALLAVGGATLGGGVAWWITATPATRSEPAVAVLGVSGRF